LRVGCPDVARPHLEPRKAHPRDNGSQLQVGGADIAARMAANHSSDRAGTKELKARAQQDAEGWYR
jgi:hypothetical protein